MKDLEQARNFLSIAARDYRALCGMEDAEVFSDEIFGFHVQQAVEKALKAWLCSLGVRQITPIHLSNNAFGGTAIYMRFLETINVFNT